MALYHTTDADGISEICPDPGRMREIIAQLDHTGSTDKDHPDISLVHDESGWSLSLFPSGIVLWENLDEEDAAPRYIQSASRGKAHELWIKLSRGDLAAIETEPWESQLG